MYLKSLWFPEEILSQSNGMGSVITVKSRHIPKFTRQYGFFTDMSPSSVPHQNLPTGISRASVCFGGDQCWADCGWLWLGVTALLFSEKAVGPGDAGKALWQQLGALSRCCLSITPRYILYTAFPCTHPQSGHDTFPIVWTSAYSKQWCLSLPSSFIPKRGEATSKSFCETSYLCKAHQMLPEQQVVIEAGPGCKEYFLGCKRKKNPFPPPKFLLMKSFSKLFP